MKSIDYHHIVSEFCRKNNLSIRFSTDMPDGYETANGTFDISKNTLFFNASMLADAPEYERLFYLYHELRHALQYTHPERFPAIIQQSLPYVLMYDGTCCKMVQDDWKECRIQGSETYLSDAYLGQPYEVDANNYAYKKVKDLYGSSAELEKLYSFWMPNTLLSDADYIRIYSEIDEKVADSSAEN